jgi:hypothetical protein
VDEWEWELEREELLRPRADAAIENRTTMIRIVSVCFMVNALSQERVEGKFIVKSWRLHRREKQFPRRVKPF